MIGARDDRRIRQLIESAGQADAAGRRQEAAQLVRQAEAAAPRHPWYSMKPRGECRCPATLPIEAATDDIRGELMNVHRRARMGEQGQR